MMTAIPASSQAPSESGFVWGVSTSSYQIEGAVREGGRGPSIWDTHCRQQGRVARGETGDVACDHYHRYAEDVGLMRELGVGGYRFSIAWPRVLPTGRGVTNEAGLVFYDRLIDALLDAKIEPWLCLYHWDLPQALEDLGGWTNRDIASWFADYVTVITRRYGDRVKRFATFNEPSVFTLFGYAFGWNAPAIADRSAFYRAVHHVNLAHGAAVDVIRATAPGATIGAVHNRQPCLPVGDAAADKAAVQVLDAIWNRAFPDPQILGLYPPEIAEAIEPYQQAGDLARICRPVDWFGLNHYGPIYSRADPASTLGFVWADPPGILPRSDIGWHVRPEAFRDDLLLASRRYKLPVYVLENGFGGPDQPDADGAIMDQHRIDYLSSYIAAMRDAMQQGADIRGYFIWSLLDNFEWGSGYADRFGLVYVDYATQRRLPKASFRWYADFIRHNRTT